MWTSRTQEATATWDWGLSTTHYRRCAIIAIRVDFSVYVVIAYASQPNAVHMK